MYSSSLNCLFSDLNCCLKHVANWVRISKESRIDTLKLWLYTRTSKRWKANKIESRNHFEGFNFFFFKCQRKKRWNKNEFANIYIDQEFTTFGFWRPIKSGVQNSNLMAKVNMFWDIAFIKETSNLIKLGFRGPDWKLPRAVGCANMN